MFFIAVCNSQSKQSEPKGLLAKAFIEDESVRELFIKVAQTSIDLYDETKADAFIYAPKYNSFQDAEEAYYYFDNKSGYITDDSMRVDEETAIAIKRLKELFPGNKDYIELSIWMGSIVNEGRVCVGFLIENYERFRHVENIYSELLTYSLYDLSDLEIYEYKKIEDNWYVRFMNEI